jgi:hypothetical protein
MVEKHGQNVNDGSKPPMTSSKPAEIGENEGKKITRGT